METITCINENTCKETCSVKSPVWECDLCHYQYLEEPPFNELNEDWHCPLCGVSKEHFHKK